MRKIGIILLFVFFIACIFPTSCSMKSDTKLFKENREDMERAVQMILDGEIEVKDDGWFTLPEGSASLSDTGEGCIVKYSHEDYRVYFFTFRGMLGSSKGFLYKLSPEEYSKINKSTNRFNFVNVKAIDDRWCTASTDD